MDRAARVGRWGDGDIGAGDEINRVLPAHERTIHVHIDGTGAKQWTASSASTATTRAADCERVAQENVEVGHRAWESGVGHGHVVAPVGSVEQPLAGGLAGEN